MSLSATLLLSRSREIWINSMPLGNVAVILKVQSFLTHYTDRATVGLVLCHHMASLGHNELNHEMWRYGGYGVCLHKIAEWCKQIFVHLLKVIWLTRFVCWTHTLQFCIVILTNQEILLRLSLSQLLFNQNGGNIAHNSFVQNTGINMFQICKNVP